MLCNYELLLVTWPWPVVCRYRAAVIADIIISQCARMTWKRDHYVTRWRAGGWLRVWKPRCVMQRTNIHVSCWLTREGAVWCQCTSCTQGVFVSVALSFQAIVRSIFTIRDDAFSRTRILAWLRIDLQDTGYSGSDQNACRLLIEPGEMANVSSLVLTGHDNPLSKYWRDYTTVSVTRLRRSTEGHETSLMNIEWLCTCFVCIELRTEQNVRKAHTYISVYLVRFSCHFLCNMCQLYVETPWGHCTQTMSS